MNLENSGIKPGQIWKTFNTYLLPKNRRVAYGYMLVMIIEVEEFVDRFSFERKGVRVRYLTDEAKVGWVEMVSVSKKYSWVDEFHHYFKDPHDKYYNTYNNDYY